jgi:hypothetical protein
MGQGNERRLDADAIVAGFETMGTYLRERGVTGEIAIYGGSAILLQFDWRTITQDVDALVSSGGREDLVKDAAAYAGLMHGLPDEWLNNFVGGFTPLTERPEFFSPFGAYPADGTPGLRVKLARPEYLCAMKLRALERADPQDKDFNDAVRLAREAGVTGQEELASMYAAHFPDEDLPHISQVRLPEVAAEASATEPRA